MELPFAEAWKIKMVEPIRKSTRQEREQWLKEAHYNVFQLKSEQVYIDLITDSGTGAMSDRQWAGMMLGDESYAGATSFFKLKEVITRLTGFEYIIPTHQGRAAENVLFSYLVHEGDIVPGNSHFDTTKGHIEGRRALALDCTIDEAKQTQLEIPFKGNVDPKKLEKALQEHSERIPFVIVTITNNTAGGQPVSMQNLREVRAIADKYGKPVPGQPQPQSINRPREHGEIKDADINPLRNKRDVWKINTVPFKGGHYAAYPPKLVETCLLAGCPEGGIVLDPFMGSGTTGMVASQMGRHFIGIELNPAYTELAYKRIGGEI
jgi:tryptophanase